MSESKPPSLKEDGTKGTDEPNDTSRLSNDHSFYLIHICNLSQSTTETNLRELVEQFGPIRELFLSKGFAYVNYEKKDDASKAIANLNGHKYHHLILTVDWCTPKNTLTDKCLNCGGNHWTFKCQGKNTCLAGEHFPDDRSTGDPGGAETNKLGQFKCVSASLKKGGTKRIDGPNMGQRNYKYYAVRIDNLSDSTTQSDLKKLVETFGLFKKLFLAMDKSTGLCNGFAYVHFKFENDAAKAITNLNGLEYKHRILKADWSTRMNSPGGPDQYKYFNVPAGLSEGRTQTDNGLNMDQIGEKYWAIGIDNLDKSTTESDLEELVKTFGIIHKLYLAKHISTGLCKGFAYVHFKFENDAAKAITNLNGHEYNHRILSADWYTPKNSLVTKCLNCGGNHWTFQCQRKNKRLAGGNLLDYRERRTSSGPGGAEANKPGQSKYVPPASFREGATKGADGQNMSQKNYMYHAIRIANLSESTTTTDLEKLVKAFGPIHKLFLAKDRSNNLCKRFAFVHFISEEDAAKAIANLNGHEYNYLILRADWYKPKNILGDKCLNSSGNGLTPMKRTPLAGAKLLDDKKVRASSGPNGAQTNKPVQSKYIPASLKESAAKRADGPITMDGKDNYNAIRIGNLSESTTKCDLKKLVEKFGPTNRLFLAKDMSTGLCRGFAYVHYSFKTDAVKAIAGLNGLEHNNLFLNVHWSSPMNSR